MKCPHCLDSFHSSATNFNLGGDADYFWKVSHENCPACGKRIIILLAEDLQSFHIHESILAYPRGSNRPPVPTEVDDVEVISDYNEACLVLQDSPKASAALSRRSLQHILREKVGVKKSDLSNEIQEVLDNNLLPADLSENLDAIRNIGNFAAHPIKSTSTGELVDVEPGEAEWNLEVLEDLMDYAFVRPERSLARKEKLNEKLRDAGKPEIK